MVKSRIPISVVFCFLLEECMYIEAFCKNAQLTRSVIQRVWEFPTCKRSDRNGWLDPACQVLNHQKMLLTLKTVKTRISQSRSIENEFEKRYNKAILIGYSCKGDAI